MRRTKDRLHDWKRYDLSVHPWARSGVFLPNELKQPMEIGSDTVVSSIPLMTGEAVGEGHATTIQDVRTCCHIYHRLHKFLQVPDNVQPANLQEAGVNVTRCPVGSVNVIDPAGPGGTQLDTIDSYRQTLSVFNTFVSGITKVFLLNSCR